MAISTIGESYEYFYNTSTGKLESTTGVYDPFVEYFNGNLSQEELPDTLNGFDAQRKCDINAMFRLFCGTERGKLYEKLNSGESFTISANIIDGEVSEYYIDGEKVFTAHHAVYYTPSEINIFSTMQQPYNTHGSPQYNAATNSLRIGVGTVLNFGNGYKLTVGNDTINGEGYGSGSKSDDKKLDILAYGLNALIHFADQQWFSSAITEESTSMLLELLRQLGVDTSREFTINETRCEVVDGKIREAGNRTGVPSTIYEAALKRYEEYLYKPLSERYSS